MLSFLFLTILKGIIVKIKMLFATSAMAEIVSELLFNHKGLGQVFETCVHQKLSFQF